MQAQQHGVFRCRQPFDIARIHIQIREHLSNLAHAPVRHAQNQRYLSLRHSADQHRQKSSESMLGQRLLGCIGKKDSELAHHAARLERVMRPLTVFQKPAAWLAQPCRRNESRDGSNVLRSGAMRSISASARAVCSGSRASQ